MRISIPKPCNENWSDMTPEEQGAFCKVCSKVVVDFSKMSDEEVISYLEKKKDEKTCGRFRTSQLSPYQLKVNVRAFVTKGKFPKIFLASLFIFFSSLFVCKSDTGELITFNKVIADTVDTARFTLTVDSTGTTAIDTITDLSGEPVIAEETEPITFAGQVLIEPTIIDTTPITIGDTIIIAEPVKMGIIAAPRPFTKGKVVCTKKDTTPKQKPDKQYMEGEVKIMGDYDFR